MTGPVWDGRGEDPWMPERLAAELDAAAAERSIREAVWAALSDWLVRLSRRVLRGQERPDPDAVWALAPAWREAVDLIIGKAIEPAMRRAYTALLGDDYPWDQRVFVTRYLAEVRNRLVRIPEEVYDLIAGQMAAGVNLGESIPQLANRVDEVLAVTTSERWQNRAVTIARSEVIGALNAGRTDAFRAFAEETGEVLERVWLATEDARTRETHRIADGQRVGMDQPFVVGGFPLMFPGDPAGPPQETVNCRCTVLLVEPGESVDLSNRQMRRS